MGYIEFMYQTTSSGKTLSLRLPTARDDDDFHTNKNCYEYLFIYFFILYMMSILYI